MRTLLISAAALLLAACATPPQQSVQLLQSQAPALRIDAVASLATSPCEEQTAPLYTAAKVMADQAAARVRAGTIALDRAAIVERTGRAVRADLDAACPDKQRADPFRLRRAAEGVATMRAALGD